MYVAQQARIAQHVSAPTATSSHRPQPPQSMPLHKSILRSPAMTSNSRNIYVVGAQSTGKTTLVDAIEKHFSTSNPLSTESRPVIIREVARSVLHTHAFAAADIRSSRERALELQTLILHAQLVAERRALEAGGWFISDRSGVDPICYALRYVGGEGASQLIESDEWQELGERMAKGLIIVCEAGGGWLQDDGVRLMPLDRNEWTSFHKLFCNALDQLGMPYTVLPANLIDLSERVDFVLSKVPATG